VEAERKKGGAATDVPPRQEWAQVGPDGRVVIPASYRKLLGIEDGGPLLMLLEDGDVRLVGRDAAIRRAQSLVARHVPAGVSLVDELIAERRAEAAREERGE
jgi:AbrB family looped-hinge helix DNA binding protein